MSYIIVDVETDGPIPGDYSMLAIGAVIVKEGLKKTFYSNIKPISDKYQKETLKFLGLTRKETLKYKTPKKVMIEFVDWIKQNSKGKPIFISDNNGFDWMFLCWYLWHFIKENPFGHNSKNLSSIYKGLEKNMGASIKNIRNKLNHNALDDAKNNAEALLNIQKKYGLKF